MVIILSVIASVPSAVALFAMIALAVVETQLAWRMREPDGLLVPFVALCVFTAVVLCWLAAFSLIGWIPLLALLASTLLVPHVIAAFRPNTIDPFMLQLRRGYVRRECWPPFATLVLACVKLSSPNHGMTFTAVCAPLFFHACCHVCYVLYLLAKHGLGMGWAPMVTFVSLANTPTLGSQPEGVELKTDERSVYWRDKAVRLLDELRLDDALHAYIHQIKRELATLSNAEPDG